MLYIPIRCGTYIVPAMRYTSIPAVWSLERHFALESCHNWKLIPSIFAARIGGINASVMLYFVPHAVNIQYCLPREQKQEAFLTRNNSDSLQRPKNSEGSQCCQVSKRERESYVPGMDHWTIIIHMESMEKKKNLEEEEEDRSRDNKNNNNNHKMTANLNTSHVETTTTLERNNSWRQWRCQQDGFVTSRRWLGDVNDMTWWCQEDMTYASETTRKSSQFQASLR